MLRGFVAGIKVGLLYAFWLPIFVPTIMKKIFICCLMGLIVACGQNAETPDNALDSGRQFIEAVFKGNFKRARQLTLPDETNFQLLDEKMAKSYSKISSLEKDRLRNASIVISQVENQGDTLSIIHFLNAYDQKPTVIKVVKRQGQWLTDVKFSFPGK